MFTWERGIAAGKKKRAESFSPVQLFLGQLELFNVIL